MQQYKSQGIMITWIPQQCLTTVQSYDNYDNYDHGGFGYGGGCGGGYGSWGVFGGRFSAHGFGRYGRRYSWGYGGRSYQTLHWYDIRIEY